MALPPLDDHVSLLDLDLRPHVLPSFFVPRLRDKPQNPIMDTLDLIHKPSAIPPRLAHELESWLDTACTPHNATQEKQDDLWDIAAGRTASSVSQWLSL